jgi:hypothetical protein
MLLADMGAEVVARRVDAGRSKSVAGAGESRRVDLKDKRDRCSISPAMPMR